jgi:hypothetical protein
MCFWVSAGNNVFSVVFQFSTLPGLKNSGTQKVFAGDKCSSRDKTAEITAVPSSNSAAVTMGYGWKNSYCPWFCRFMLEGIHA